MLDKVASGNLKAADDTFVSLQSEYLNSSLLPDAMLILAQAHANAQEYATSDYFLDEYTKRFGDDKNLDYISYLKIKNHFFAFVNSSKDQQFLDKSIQEASDFLSEFKDSRYAKLVDSIRLRLILGRNELDSKIAKLYEKSDKKEAGGLYEARIDSKLLKNTKPTPTHVGFFKKLFSW